jgi:hypothetical protein
MSFMVPHDPTDPRLASLPLATLLDRVIPPVVLQEVVSRHRPPRSRSRKLSGAVVLLLVIALFLYPATELSTLLGLLLLPQRLRRSGPSAAGKSSISRARYRWGPRPLAALMRRVCRPLATLDTPGAFRFGLRTVAFDGSYEYVADTTANTRAFGRYRSQHGPAAFPQLLGLYLVECGTHAVLDACPWPCRTSEHRAVRRLLRSVTPEMLVLWDSGLHSYGLAQKVRERGAHFLSRVPACQTFQPIRALPDGSLLARWYRDPPSKRAKDCPFLEVRIVTYEVDGDPKPLRLVTSLLDPAQAPALDLVMGYHERWEIEGTFDELRTHQRLSLQPFRSQKPQGVIQEFYGLVLAHYVVRCLLADVAAQQAVDPDRLSFTRAVRLLPAALLLAEVLPPPEQAVLLREVSDLLGRALLPARRHRGVPRARKRASSKYQYRKKRRGYTITRLAPFRDRVTIHAPPSPAAA